MTMNEPEYSLVQHNEFNGRYYTTDREGYEGIKFPSVTTVLNLMHKDLLNWNNRNIRESLMRKYHSGATITPYDIDISLATSEDIRRQSATYGTRAHEVIEKYINHARGFGPKPFIPEEVAYPVNAFIRWMEKEKVQPLMAEAKVMSFEHNFAGTLDILCWYKHEESEGELLSIIDIKTGNGVYPESAIQQGAYALATEETYGVSVDSAYVLKIPKSSKERLKLHRVKNLEESKQQFIGLARLWSYLDEGVFGEEPKNDKATGDNEVSREG